MKNKMNSRFRNLQGGLFSKVTKADVGENSGKLMQQGYTFMSWADPFFPDPSLPESVKKVIIEAISELPENEKKVIVLYYHEDLTFKEIGKVLNVSESRISQLHTKANLRLRAKLTNIRKGII